MALYALFEHSTVNKILKEEEETKGFLEKFRVSVPENSVHTAFAEMPGKEYDVYRVEVDGELYFLVPNEMDDYYRYQPLKEAAFDKKPEFLGQFTPLKDIRLKKEQEELKRKEESRIKNEKSHIEFFTNASKVNQEIPGFFDIPDTLDEFVESLGSEFSSNFRFDMIAKDSADAIDRYREITSSSPSEIDFGKSYSPLAKKYKLLEALREKAFEVKYGFSIETTLINDEMISMKAINPKGKVIEEASISVLEDVAYFEEGPERVHKLDVFCEDNVFKRYGKHIDFDDSLLSVLVDEFEDCYFELGENPDLPEYDEDGNDVLGINSLQAPQIYTLLSHKQNDVAKKLALVSKVSLDKMVDHDSPKTEVTPL